MWATLSAVAHARGEQILSLGPTSRDVAGSLPMPAGRMALGGSVMADWMALTDATGACFAWDVDAVVTAAAAGLHVVPVLDGLHGSGSCTRRTAISLAARSMPAIVGSPAVSEMLHVAAGCEVASHLTPVVPPVAAPGPEGDSVLEIVVLGEPIGRVAMHGIVGLIGRLQLLGRSPRVRIAGDPYDRHRTCAMLTALGADDIRICDLSDLWAHVGAGSIIWFGPTWRPSGQIESAGPAMRAWALGATVLLADEHAAADTLQGRPGVHINVDRHADAALRTLSLGMPTDGQDRAEVAAHWWSELLEALERFSVHARCAC